jgi:hypothetical protein
MSSLRHNLELMINAADKVWDGKGVDAERMALAYGSEFIGVPRPRGFRKMKAKQCHANSWKLALDGRGFLCEGFATKRGESHTFHHSWICLSDGTVVDATLPDPENYEYLGVKFDGDLYWDIISEASENPDFGVWGFLREPLVKSHLEAC